MSRADRVVSAVRRLGLRLVAPAGPAEARRRRVAVLALVVTCLTFSALFGKGGFLDRVRWERERDRLAAEVAALEAEVAAERAALARLAADPKGLERTAREELGLGLPGEALVLLDPGARDPRRAPDWIGPTAPSRPAVP